MTDPAATAGIALAQARATAARARLSGTIGALQQRARPQVLAHDVAESLKEKGRAAFSGAVDTARRRPVAVGIGLTLVGLFLARGPIAKAVRHATGREPGR